MGNPFVHVELNTTNLPKAKAFYAETLRLEAPGFPDGDAGR